MFFGGDQQQFTQFIQVGRLPAATSCFCVRSYPLLPHNQREHNTQVYHVTNMAENICNIYLVDVARVLARHFAEVLVDLERLHKADLANSLFKIYSKFIAFYEGIDMTPRNNKMCLDHDSTFS